MILSDKQADFITMPFNHTLDVAEGTPRSGKTTACIARYFTFLNVSKDSNHLIVGASQPQAFRLVLDGDGNGLLHLFGNKAGMRHDDHGDHLECQTANGTKKIYYKGGAKADSDKSIRGLSLGSVYFCEIDILHMNMIQECFRRTYAADIRWHIADLNPPAPLHPVISDVFDVQYTKWTHWTIDDNPVLTPERKKELHDTLIKNPYLYKRDWLGERVIPQGVIYSMFDKDAHVLDKLPDGFAPFEMMFSGDGGLTDATSISCYYKGGAKADSDKSIRGLSLGSVYFCEIDILHMNMIQECFRRTYAADIRWHIADLNPPAPLHPVISDVFDVQYTKWTHWTIDDNPVLTPERKKELHDTLIKNPYLYKRDWLGERVIPQGVIYSMFDKDAHVLDKLPDGFAPFEMMFSGDGGLTDATSISCNLIGMLGNKYVMIRVANWYYDGENKAMSTQAKEIVRDFVPYCRQRYQMESCWKIDPACKALRMELRLLGIETDKADNNGRDVKGNRKGIEVGIEYLQSAITDGRFFVLNDARFGVEPFMKEIGMYCVDDNGKPVDAYNHAMDEARYANNYFYKRYVL